MRSSTPLILAGVGLALAACDGPANKSAETAAAPAAAPATDPAGGVIALNTPPKNAHLVSGWSAPESSGVWTNASRAVLRVSAPAVAAGGALKVSLDALAYLPKGKTFQRVDVSVGSERITELKLVRAGYQPMAVSVPGRLIHAGQPVDLTFDLPDALSPAAVEPGSTDNRLLGMGLKSVTIGG